jgi:hypothetical protein
VVLALAVTLLPSIRTTARFVHGEISDGHRFSRQVNRLADVIARRGGAAHIKRCGQPVSALEFQSVLAWEVELNVGDVGWRPQTEIRSGRPIVLFEPKGLGWRVRPLHVHDATCDALRAGTPVA